MQSAIRNFIIVFVLALLGFGILGHFIATSAVPAFIKDGFDADRSVADSSDVVSEDLTQGDEISPDTSETTVEGNTYNFAFFCLDPNSKLAGVYLVRTHDGYKTCITVSLPGNASVESNGAYTTLTKFYADNGKESTVKKLYYLTGCRIDEYATLAAADLEGKGRTITALSTYLSYTYRITKEFRYPNPNYIIGGVGGDDESSQPFDNNEYIQIAPGSYALNGETNGVPNDRMLLDTEWNPNAFDIYNELLTRMLYGAENAASASRQTTIFGYLAEKSFRNYEGSGASAYLFNSFYKANVPYSGTGGAWDEIREAIKTLERKVQNQ